jgi:hypothetical protein
VKAGSKITYGGSVPFHAAWRGVLVVGVVLAISDVRQISAQIVDLRFDSENGQARLTLDSCTQPGAVYEVYARYGAQSLMQTGRTWVLVREDVRADESGMVDISLGEPMADSGFFAVGRADMDANANGISDIRERLMEVQDLPAERRAGWACAGLESNSTTYTNVVNIRAVGAKGDGVTDDTSAINNAINNLKTPGVLYLPAGTYRITQPLYLKPNMILRGAGAEATRLRFSGSGTAGRCLAIARWDSQQTNAWYNVVGDMTQGSTQIALSAVTGLRTGDVVEIEQDNDPAWNLNESWQARLQGQIMQVVAVNATSRVVTVEPPLRIGYRSDRNPKMRKLVTISKAGIEDLFVERADAVDGYTIELKYAVNCWVRRVESAKTYKAHVWIERGFRNVVRESYFHHAYVYGGGGQGYGVGLGRHTSDTLVEDNVFDTLRHSMSVGHGANGNVFAYNFSTNRAIDPVYGTPQADISVHGNWVYMNLFEGNVVEDADVPDWYFPAGPGNTLFRNRIVNRDTAIEVVSDGQSFVGNELPAGCVTVDASVRDVLLHGNCVGGSVAWQPELCRNLPASYFRCVRPDFIPADDPEISWPPIGPGRAASAGKIPAERRYALGEYIP